MEDTISDSTKYKNFIVEELYFCSLVKSVLDIFPIVSKCVFTCTCDQNIATFEMSLKGYIEQESEPKVSYYDKSTDSTIPVLRAEPGIGKIINNDGEYILYKEDIQNMYLMMFTNDETVIDTDSIHLIYLLLSPYGKKLNIKIDYELNPEYSKTFQKKNSEFRF